MQPLVCTGAQRRDRPPVARGCNTVEATPRDANIAAQELLNSCVAALPVYRRPSSLKETLHASCFTRALAASRLGRVPVLQQQQPIAAGKQHHRRDAAASLASRFYRAPEGCAAIQRAMLITWPENSIPDDDIGNPPARSVPAAQVLQVNSPS